VKDFSLKKMPGHPTLTADPLVDKIYSIIADNIITLHLPPESQLTEDNIARVLGVSRSPIREAAGRFCKKNANRKLPAAAAPLCNR
jgi:DNA-binding GntR family transcriptional regulator